MSSSSSAFNFFIPMDEKEEELALSTVGYTRSRLAEDLTLLRAWIAQQPHFPPSSQTESDEFLSNFLVGCKGSIERCKKKLDGYYTWRRRSTIFADRHPNSPGLLAVCKGVNFVMMPKCLPTGYRLLILRLKTSQYFDLTYGIRLVLLFFEKRIRFGGLTAGDTAVVDCSDCNASYLPSLNPSVIRDFMTFFQDSLATRCSNHFIINCPPIAETILNKMVRPWMSKKMSERIVVTREGNQFLLEKFPKDVLPSDYGGDAPSLDDLQEKMLQSSRELANYGDGEFFSRLSELTDESKRPKDSPIAVSESLFGVQGTIKSLTID
ncbi:hypothetical protein GE061_013681 [Apolygus lucorum]|uniref:Uncharacterized protein n=1 Tax=Apolygus lucorum TaxID=248454 RepID=A0A6A4KA57_APOLU|nr:hypothetical protein GE061_013681 [Apolygus lucorum]